MATIIKTPSKTWKALIRKRGWPTTIKTFRTKRDAQDWARRTENDMVRGAYIDLDPSESTTLKLAMNRYLAEVSPTKSAGTKRRETVRAKPLLEELGDYALVAITPDLIGRYRDKRLCTNSEPWGALGAGRASNGVADIPQRQRPPWMVEVQVLQEQKACRLQSKCKVAHNVR